MDGILLIDKPAGWTSFDVVAKVRSVIRSELGDRGKRLGGSETQKSLYPIPYTLNPRPKVKVGHTGTLDPFATGLLILVIGSYCKRAAEFSGLPKTYQVTAKLGQISSTGDPEGEISPVSQAEPSEAEVLEVVNDFTGEISQTPPAHSAIKVNGQRAYKLARQGKAVELEPRKVTIHSIEDINYSYPTLSFTANVSSGTYIRSLVQDIGQKLGTDAYTVGLRRTKVGEYELNEALKMDSELNAQQIEQAMARPH